MDGLSALRLNLPTVFSNFEAAPNIINTSNQPRKITVTLPEYFDTTTFSAVFGNSFQLNGNELEVEMPPVSVEIVM